MQYTYIIETDEELPWVLRLIAQAIFATSFKAVMRKQGIEASLIVNEVTEAHKALQELQ